MAAEKILFEGLKKQNKIFSALSPSLRLCVEA